MQRRPVPRTLEFDTAAMEEVIAKREAKQVVQLPLWPEPKRGAPNTFLRSALFAAVQGQSRRWMRQEVVGSLSGIRVKYTGELLIQSDLDVWETLVHLARRDPLGTACSFTAYGVLRSMERGTGNSQHKWLHSALTRLGACMVEISHEGRTYSGSLLEDLERDDITRAYKLRLNRNLIRLFQDNQWTQLDWGQRQRLRRQPLAQALHAFWSTHRKPYPIKVATLHSITGSTSKQLRDYKRKLRAALTVLVNNQFLESFRIEPARDGGDLVTVTRSHPPSLQLESAAARRSAARPLK